MQTKDFIPRIGKGVWHAKVPSTNERRLETLKELQEVLNRLQLELAIAESEYILVLDEAITNAMEHGNGWDAKKMVSIDIRQRKNYLLFYITDEGKGFDISQAAENMSQNMKLSLRGRGIYIISNLCEVQWNAAGNEICLKVPLQSPSAGH